MSKNEIGKYISNWHEIITTFFFNPFNFRGLMTLLHIALKNELNWVMTCQTFLSKMLQITTYSVALRYDNQETLNQLIWNLALRQTSWHLKSNPIALWCLSDTNKFSFLFMSMYDMLGANMPAYHETMDLHSSYIHLN